MTSSVSVRRLFLFIVILVIVFIGCKDRHHYPQTLIVADSLADHNPDSALSYLDRLAPQMAKASDADLMYYRLLCVKSADKAYIPHTSDSLIRPLIAYYEQDGDPQLLPVAYYYGGRVNMDLGDAPQAIVFFQKALDEINLMKNGLELKGLCYSQIGYLQVQESFYDYAMDSFRDALSCFVTLRDTIRILYCLEDIGSTYNYMGERKKGLYTLLKAKELTNAHQQQDYPFLDNQIARTYLNLGQHDSAIYYISNALSYPTASSRYPSYSIAANIFRDTHEKDSMKHYAELLLGGDLINKRYAYRLLGEYHTDKGELKSAVSYYKKWANINDTVDEILASRTVAQLHALYNYQLREKENQKLKYESELHMGIIIASFLVCLFLCLIILLVVKHQGKKNKLLSLKLEKYERLVSEYDSRKQRTDMSLLQSIKSTSAYVQLIECIHTDSRMLDGLKYELKDEFTRYYPDFFNRLSDLCKMSESNYMMCMLIKLDINPSEIAILTCKTKQAISSARKRLYKKAFGRDESPEKWDEIIRSL